MDITHVVCIYEDHDPSGDEYLEAKNRLKEAIEAFTFCGGKFEVTLAGKKSSALGHQESDQ